MQRLAILALMVALAVGAFAVRGSAAATSTTHRPISMALLRTQSLAILHNTLSGRGSGQEPELQPVGTGTTIPTGTGTAAVPTGTETAVVPTATTPPSTPTALPTATKPRYPDPITLLQSEQIVFQNIDYVHYVDDFSGEIVGIVKDSYRITGDGNSTQPAFTAHVALQHRDEIGKSTTKLSADYVVIGKFKHTKQYARGKASGCTGSSAKCKKWRVVKKASKVCVAFPDRAAGPCSSYPLDNPLVNQTTAPPSGTGGGQPRDLVNLGPQVVNGTAAWHLQFTIVNQGVPIIYGLYIAQSGFLPLESTISVDDKKAKPEQKLFEDEFLTKFNKKFSVKAPLKKKK